MSDVMKQVVQEILQGDRKPVTSQDNDAIQKKSELDIPLQNIKRPNYQLLNKTQRLSFDAKNVGNTASSSKPADKAIKSRSVSLLPKQFNEESISKLHSKSLVQGNVPTKSKSYSQQYTGKAKSSRIIGTIKKGGCVWFFPQLAEDLMGSFQRSLNSVAVGVVKMPECLPSHILLINEIIRNNQDVKFHISWNKDGQTPFTAELYDDDVDRLEKIMNDIFQKLNRRSLKQYEAYTAISPSPWLSKQMNITPSTEAIAFLEGISYYSSILLMDTLLKSFESSDFTYEINSNYIFFEGNYHVISKMVAELKKEAARLVSSDMIM
ncbi:hypothetical protein [Virgibacillus sp. DJP39]|uniref:hypothetical protein n=1 Tax=Virgibacillus sp. DJP39 TaxID=3409790 RepID=UPI003BB714EC